MHPHPLKRNANLHARCNSVYQLNQPSTHNIYWWLCSGGLGEYSVSMLALGCWWMCKKKLSEICIIGSRRMIWFSHSRDIIRENMSSQPTAKHRLGYHLKKLQSRWGSEPSNWSKDCWMAFCSYHHPQLESRNARKHDVLVMSRYQSNHILKVWINVKNLFLTPELR